MDSLLILGGLLLILTGLVWLVMRAFGTSLLWGWASLLPPLTLGYLFRHWKSARQPLGLCALGFIPLIVGLTMLAGQDSQRMAEIVSLKWLNPDIQAPTELNFTLHGELNGQNFNPQQGELVDGVLMLREGQDFFARREVVIRLAQQPSDGPVRLDVLPEDTGSLPEVEINWLLPEQELPEARRLRHGYTLHLDLTPLAPNKLQGDFHLVLPPQFKTTLSGKVELFSNGLRYVQGKVDRSINSRDTIAFILDDYLQRRFITRNVQLSPLPALTFSSNTLDLTVEARINDEQQLIPLQLTKSASNSWLVKDDRYTKLPKELEQTQKVTSPPAVVDVPNVISKPIDRRQRFSLESLLRNPGRYTGLTMRAITERGSQAEGRFRGIDNDGNIVLQQLMKGAGGASFTVEPEQVKSIELLEP